METEHKPPTEKLFDCIKSFEKGASKLTAWSLSIIGGSILILIDSSYLRPFKIDCRYPYMLFLFGWVFIGISMFQGFSITRSSMVADLYRQKEDFLIDVLQKCNSFFRWQLKFFQLALLCFGLWLVYFLFWWIYTNIPVSKP